MEWSHITLRSDTDKDVSQVIRARRNWGN